MEMLELVKETFYEMTLFVEPPITFALVDSIGFRRDGVACILVFDVDQYRIHVITAICQDHASSNGNTQQRIYCCGAVIGIARRQL